MLKGMIGRHNSPPSPLPPNRRSRGALMRGARWRLPLLALALLAIVAIALTPTEEAEAQSVPALFFISNVGGGIEDGKGYHVTVNSNADVTANLTVNYTLGGTATCGVDYTIPGANCSAMTGTFQIDAGTKHGAEIYLIITYLEDAVSDNQETLILTIVAGSGYTLGSTSATTVTIYENSGKAMFMTSGTPTVGNPLSSRQVCADPDGDGTFNYRWLRSDKADGTRIGRPVGASSTTYTLQQADVGKYLLLRATYTDSGGLYTQVYTSPIGPIGQGTNNKVQFSRDSYNVREGDPLRPTLVFDSPTRAERTFEIAFYNCNTELGPGRDVEVTRYSDGRVTSGFAATHRVTVPAGVSRHTFSLPVLLDDEIEEAESFVLGFRDVPSGFGIGMQNDAHVQITNVSLVPENWTLKPAAVNVGDQFRLLFKTGNERNAASGDIAAYDHFIRFRTTAHPWHADIQAYEDTFRVVGSTSAVDAAWHTATGIMVNDEPSHTPFSHPIYWLNGPKIADDYNDFWDGTWDNNANAAHRHGDGLVATNNRGPNTGTKSGTTHATAGTKANNYLGHGTMTRWGGGQQNQNPINQGGIPVNMTNVYMGLSGIFMPLNVSAANPLVTIEADREEVTEGTDITYTLRAVPAPSSPKTVNVEVTGGDGLINPADGGSRPMTIPTSGSYTFTVRTEPDNQGEPDGEVTVSIGSGTGYRTLAAYDTVMTTVISDDEYNLISASARLGDGTTGPAQTGARVDFTFALPEPRQGRELSGIKVELAYTPNVLSVESNHRPTTWDRYKINPLWKPDGSARVNHRGAYVRPWMENSILVGQQSFSLRVHVKNRAEAGGNVGNGWIAMRVKPRNDIFPAPGAEWACMPVGGGTCPSAWPGVPTTSVTALDSGSVMSGNDARFRVFITPPPPAGQTRRVYLKTWEVFVNAIDEIPNWWDDHCTHPEDQDPNKAGHQGPAFDPFIHCDPPPRNGERKVQFEAYTHVDVGSGGSAVFTLPTKIWRSTENMTGRGYMAEVQKDVAYTVADALRQAEVTTTIFDPAAAACWYGHSHHAARLITVDGMQVYAPAGMGITECRTDGEIEQDNFGIKVWTSCKPEYDHRTHPYSHAGHTHNHHNHDPLIKLGNGSCPGGQPQTLGQDSQDGEQDQQFIPYGSDTFPAPGTLGFSDVTASSMTVSWPQRTVDHYLVYWAEAVANAEAQFAQVDAGTLTYTITGLKADTEYAVIVYSQDYDEVTPTGYQRTAAATAATAATCDTADAEQKARAGYDWHVNNNGPDEGLFWRILNTLGADNLPATPSDVTDETVTAQYVSDYSDGKGWGGWEPIVAALECVEGDGSAQQDATPATPEISITGGSGITEGGNASFTLTATPAPAAALDVTVTVSQSGDFGVSPGSQTVSIPTTGSATLTVTTVNDNVDEADGSVTVAVNGGSGYTVSATASAATVAVADDDAAQRTASATATCDTADAEQKARAGYDWHTNNNGPDEGLFWRILNTLGADNLPATPSDVTDETVTAQYVSDYSDGKGWGGWEPIVAALECVEGDGSAQQDATPATPEISITGGSGITEGGNASFTLTATPAPAAALDVIVAVTQTGDFGVTPGSQTVSIPTSGSAPLTLATVNDGVDEANGSVTATLNTGTGYTVSTTAGSATVAVADDDAAAPPPPPPAPPEVSIVSDGDITEGGDASFTVTATPAPAAALDVTVAVTQTGDFGVTPGSQTVSIPTSGSAPLTVTTSDDSVDEADGSVTATINTGQTYTVSSTAGSATVAVADDDDPPAPPVNATPSFSISDASADEDAGTIAFTVTLSPSSSKYAWVRYYARPQYGQARSANYSDFSRSSGYGELTFKPGDTEKTISVTLVNDTVSEGDETFAVVLYSPIQAAIKDDEGIGTIVDDDPPPSLAPPRTADAPPPPPAPKAAAEVQAAPDYTALIAQMYAWRHDPQRVADQAYTARWDRALLAFGQPVTDPTLTPMTAAEAQALADRGWTRWEDVADALRAIEAADADQDEETPAPDDPHAPLIAQMYAWRYAPQWQASQAYSARWDRALLAFGEAVLDTTLTPMTAEEAQALADQGMTRWEAVAAALRALEANDP